ncbi:hypothetical protein ONA91_19295 [Micromonospora sp. DR5-3]|uniref:hypothetical protein n=1 Tax=unclassified Micromonospora TaxID=2617518 RepID=UPI0011D787AC|nr:MULTISPECIES: hypothetical protein [unclassified Micromonospora]MCW3816595.1 hypothetical protein [Micromonospora sp. DR5-3]TYC20216.1 hypothetical protein FXF52_32385 [Micromonospora sp. MP36]
MRRVLALFVAAVVAAGCSLGEVLADDGDPVDLRPADVVGTWRSGAQRVITFDDHGGFTAEWLPYGVFDDFLPIGADRDANITGSGTWALGRPEQNPDGPSSAVRLTFLELAGTRNGQGSFGLSALRQDGRVRLLFFYVGPGGNSWTAYEKCDDCPPGVTPSPSVKASREAVPRQHR